MSIKFENTEVWGFEHAIRGMRNPMNSWNKIDSEFETFDEYLGRIELDSVAAVVPRYKIGSNDLELAQRLIKAGNEHRKFLRQIFVSVDITAPLYWWKEFDTYKVGTVANSCSTMHKITAKEFELSDFSTDHLVSGWTGKDINGIEIGVPGPLDAMDFTISILNRVRESYLETAETGKLKNGLTAKDVWWQMIQILPSSYNQKRTLTLNYENIRCMYLQRRNHKLDEWSIGFIEWAKSLPYAKELIMYQE